MDNYDKHFNGHILYGDDFSKKDIEKWYKEEAEGYANLGSKDRATYNYTYHNMNIFYGFSKLPKGIRFKNALGIGSAYGDEFLPIIDRIDSITILEPSEQLKTKKIRHIIPQYSKPELDGSINFKNDTFDLVICFGVLHHIPNVSYVISELNRVTKRDGFLLIKEPIHTMGDWKKARRGLTKNERGIPIEYFRKIIKKNRLTIIKESLCDCAFAYRILGSLVKRDSIIYQKLDQVLAIIFKWNYHYHRTNMFQKVAPSAVFYVLQKKMNSSNG